MKLAMEVTLDGLVRALRWKTHDLAEGVERGYASNEQVQGAQRPMRREDALRQARGEDDDRAGR